MQRISKYGDIQNIILTSDKELNILIHWTTSYVIMCRSCTPLKMVRFIGPPSVWHAVQLYELQRYPCRLISKQQSLAVSFEIMTANVTLNSTPRSIGPPFDVSTDAIYKPFELKLYVFMIPSAALSCIWLQNNVHCAEIDRWSLCLNQPEIWKVEITISYTHANND